MSASRYQPIMETRVPTEAERRSVTKWMLGLAAFFALALALASLQMFQISSEGTSKSALARSTAALTEIDALLDRHYGDMQTQAAANAPGQTLELEDFPIALNLTKEDVLGRSKEEIRALILARSADRLYEDGTGVLRESAEANSGPGRFSIDGITDGMLGQLTARNHTRFGIATILLTGIAAALCIACGSTCRGWGRLTAFGMVLAAAGGTILVGGLLALAYANSQSGSDEYVRSEFFGMIADLARAPVRNGMVCVAAGGALVVIAFAADTMMRSQRASEARS